MYGYRPRRRSKKPFWIGLGIITFCLLAFMVYYFNLPDPREGKQLSAHAPEIPESYLQSSMASEDTTSEDNTEKVDDNIPATNGQSEDSEGSSEDQNAYSNDINDESEAEVMASEDGKSDHGKISYYIIGNKDHQVAAFAVYEDGTKMLIQKTDVSLDVLMPQDEALVKKGIRADDKEELDAILEGFSN